MENNERLLEVTFAMMAGQQHKLMMDNFIYLNDNLDEKYKIAEEYEMEKAKDMMPFKYMFNMTIICVSGELRVNVDLTDLVVRENDALLITTGSIVNSVEMEPDTKLLIMAFDSDAARQAFNMDAALMRKYFMHSGVFHGDKNDIDEVRGIYQQMRLVLTHDHTDFTKRKIENFINGLVLLFMEQQDRFEAKQEYQKPSRQEDILVNFLQEIHNNCQEHRELKFYADKLCLSPRYLARVVADVSGKNASEWIKEAVILEAKAMLRSGNYTVQQVSMALNFPNQSFFGKYFKAAEGVPPRQYQQVK